MRFGVVVDGQAEFRSLPEIFPRIDTPFTLLAPLYADIQPFAPVSQIVGAVRSKLPILRSRRAERVLVLLDRETRPVCPGAWAREVETALNNGCAEASIRQFHVVIKNTCFENWLIADTAALARMPKRFVLSRTVLRSVSPNKADHVSAQRILVSAAQGEAYSKTTDAVRIMKIAQPLAIAANSRSFRRLLRKFHHPSYLDQSFDPAK
jgi:hypothetical protein